MPKKLPKNSNWVQLTKNFVKEWPEILEGLHLRSMPIRYLLYCNIILKNNATIHYDIRKELKHKKQVAIARFLKKIRSVDQKFDIPALKRDMEKKTSNILSKTFK